MADATENYCMINGGIDVDVIKIDTRTDINFKDAIKLKDVRETTTTVFNTFDKNLFANYTPPKEMDALATITIYRQIPEQNYYNFICFLPQGKISFYDFNIRNNEFYHYLAAIPVPVASSTGGDPGMEYRIYENRNRDAKNTPMFHKAYWKSWSITNIRESEIVENTYEQYGYTWNLKCNIEDESVTQNTSVTSWDTLGRYPKMSMGQKRYDSATFTGLLGDVVEFDTIKESVDEYHELIEKVTRSYGYTERFNNSWVIREGDEDSRRLVKYANEMEKLTQWKEFVNDGSLKLLKDLKGNSWIVQIMENPTYSIDNKPYSAPATISFIWQEVEDADNTAIVNMD